MVMKPIGMAEDSGNSAAGRRWRCCVPLKEKREDDWTMNRQPRNKKLRSNLTGMDPAQSQVPQPKPQPEPDPEPQPGSDPDLTPPRNPTPQPDVLPHPVPEPEPTPM